MYSFDDQLAVGMAGEALLDQVFGVVYEIRPTDERQQRQGIDRIFRERTAGRVLFVEYKTDHTAGRTGNAFVETVSIGRGGVAVRLGWAYTSQAEVLIYYVPEPVAIYWISMASLRRRLDRWLATYERRQVPNDGYYTEGLLVPLDEFEAIARFVL